MHRRDLKRSFHVHKCYEVKAYKGRGSEASQINDFGTRWMLLAWRIVPESLVLTW
jgi:hypothetical protein